MRPLFILVVVTLAACGGSNNKSTPPPPADTTPPVIMLIGDNPQFIEAGMPYTELGATASDNVDGDLTASIVVDASAVDTSVVGEYPVTYDVSDAAGNTASTVTRTVRIEPLPRPSAPTVGVEGDIKTLTFNWTESQGAEYYRLLANADGHSGFTAILDNIPAGTTTASLQIAVHWIDWINAQYIVDACNSSGCNSSVVVTATDVMLDTIGYFKASNTDSDDLFGGSVAMSADGNTIAVGPIVEASGATGVNGPQTDNSALAAGAVYLYRFDGTDWFQQAYLKASNTDAGDTFGSSVALSADGNTLAAGAWAEDSGATGVDGNQANNSSDDAGAAYLFRCEATDWLQQAYVKASNTGVGDQFFGGDNFGYAIALNADGNTLAVGADGEESNATGINGDQTDRSLDDAGALYLY